MGLSRPQRKQVRAERGRINKLREMIAAGYEINGRGQLVHRIVCRKAHGPFPHDWVVHHVDENKKNNAPSNLIAMPRKLHTSMHAALRKTGTLLSREQIAKWLKSYIRAFVKKEPAITFVIEGASTNVMTAVRPVITPVRQFIRGADKSKLRA